MKQIEEFIQFAIENGYEKLTPYRISRLTTYPKGKAFIYIITSKPFIEAIARGLSKDIKKESVKKGDIIFNTYDKFELIHRKIDNMRRGMIREITTRQAIAIRDNKLEEFITNILPGNKD